MGERLSKCGVVVVAALVALVLAGAAAPSSPPAASDQATAYQSDPAHDGYIADAGLSAPLEQAWSVTLPGGLYQASYPLIVDGMVFVTSARDKVYALNQATGSTIWSHGLGGVCCWSGLTYDRGRVFVANHGGVLTAFDAATGSIAWSTQLPGQTFFTSAPSAANGIVYLAGAGHSGTLYAVRETDGAILWTSSVASGGSAPAVTADGVYLTEVCQNAYDFDLLNGSVAWVDHLDGCSGGGGKTAVLASGHVFARYSDGNRILSSSTGNLEGAFTSPGPGPAPAVANNVAFILDSTTLKAVANAGLGSTNWTFAGDGHLNSAPLVVGGLVFVGSSSGNIYAVDATTGVASWSTNVGTAILRPDEHNSVPLTGFGAANGTLVVSAGSSLMAYRSAGTITDVPSNDGPPSVSGSVDLNETEAADVGIWSGLPSAYAYQWEQCDSAGANCVDIPGATGASYVPGAETYGATLRVRVVATNDVGSSAPVESAASPVLGLSTAAPVLSTSPVVSGSATVGEQLSTTDGTWTNSATSYAYQWQRCADSGSGCVDIPGATASQYMPVADDVGFEIRSEVLASNAIGPAPSGYVLSAPTGIVDQVGAPRIPVSPRDEATGPQLDPAHDGYIADAGLAAPLTQAWSLTLPGTVLNELIADGTVFVTTTDKTLYALNQATGSTIWSYPFGGYSTFSGLAYDRGQVFLANTPTVGHNVLTALDAASGSLAWSEPTWGVEPAAMNGIVYTAGGGVYALRESDGHPLWGTGSGYSNPLAVTAQGVFEAGGCQQEVAFDPLVGTLLWSHDSGCYGGIAGTPVVASGHVFAPDSVLGNVILSSSTGDVQGAFNQGPVLPAVAKGVAFMISDATLSALDNAGLGNEKWTFSGDGHLSTAPIVAGGLVFVGSSTGNLYAVDAATGVPLWSTSMGSAVPKSLAAANGTLVVAAGTQLVAYRNAPDITDAPSNHSLPTIDGPADLSGLEAADVGVWAGLPSAYAYQWELCDGAGANCANIAGATSLSYLPPAEDIGVGDTLRVRIVATNDIGSSDPIESVPSATSPLLVAHQDALRRRQDRVAGGPPHVGQQLTTTNGIWTNDPTSYTYKWQRCDGTGRHCTDIAGATSSQHTVVSADTGYELRSEVRARNAVGPASTYAASTPTSPIGGLARPALVSAPVVSGTVAVGSQLSTTTGTWTDGPTSFAYKWQRCDGTGSNCADIANATSSHYTLVAADGKHEIRSEVIASNAAGPAPTYAPSAPTSPVLVSPEFLSSPVVSGKAAVGSQLSTTAGTWKNAPTGYVYRWQRCDNSGSNCVNIVNATSSHYTLVAADFGHRIRSGVLARNAAGPAASGYAPSVPTSVVGRKPAVLTLPKLSGLAKVGSSLSVTTGTWRYSPTRYAYQWLRCTSLGTSCTKIVGATKSSYRLTSADAGHKLKATVTASNAAGSVTAMTSNTSATVRK